MEFYATDSNTTYLYTIFHIQTYFCTAALAAGVHLVVIGRPKEQVEPVMSLAQAEKYLSDMIRGRKENQKNGE